MTRWHQSGTRRDLCALLYAAGERRGQRLKTDLEDHYDTHLDPSQFYGVLERLVDDGHVERRTDGIHDAFSLTPSGERMLLAHHEWLTERVEAGDRGDASAE